MNRRELISQLTCPLDWSGRDSWELMGWLNFGWYAVARQYEVDREVRALISSEDFTPDLYEIESLSEDELRSTGINLRTWRAAAERDYLNRYGGLYRQRALRRDEDPKHYAQSALTPAEVIQESALRGASVLRPTITESVQTVLMWAALEDVVTRKMGRHFSDAHSAPDEPTAILTELFDRHFLLIGAVVHRPVGATDGEETPYLQFNLDLVTGHFHAYPIHKSEYETQPYRAYVQGWEYGLEK